jgi:hypothetical protein
MSLIRFEAVDAHVQALLPNSDDGGQFRLFTIKKPEFKRLTQQDTLAGYIKVASEKPVTYKEFLANNFPHLTITPKTYCIQRLLRMEDTTIFNELLPKCKVSSEPVLIDSDYIQDDQLFLAQICITNFSESFLSEYEIRMPDLVFQFTVITPPEDVQPFVYGTPLFGAMRPEDEEEFIDSAYYKQFIIPDLVLVRGSRGANGFDLAPRAIVDNSKDFHRDNLHEAVTHRIKVPACYSVQLMFPKFFTHWGEFNHMPNQFILRSRVSKMNLSLEYDFIGNRDLRLTLTNMNHFPLYIVEDPNMQDEIPMKFCQFVPSATLTSKLHSFTDADEMARFLGIVLVLNDKKRKSKV